MKVAVLGPLPAEVSAYTLARYSRSSDDLETSLSWVQSHGSSGKFLEDFYFKYGHGSIADLGNVTMGLEGVSEIAAVEIEAEQLWSGSAKSTRYQDFSKVEPVVPPDLDSQQAQGYLDTFQSLIKTYTLVGGKVRDQLLKDNPKPAEMTQANYDRTISARSFDVARYLLPMGIPTNVGQVTSIRTLEKQIPRLMASPYLELQQLAEKMKLACGRCPSVKWNEDEIDYPVAPTLAKYLKPSDFLLNRRKDLWTWYNKVCEKRWGLQESEENSNNVRLYRLGQDLWDDKTLSPTADILATLLYSQAASDFESVLSFVCSLGHDGIKDALAAALKSRGPHDDLPLEFRNQPYTFEITMDLGAYRDLHRHRRCQQVRQDYTIDHGYEIPDMVKTAGCYDEYVAAQNDARSMYQLLWPCAGADYILPLATRVRTLFKMDFAEADYICRLRSKVGGHISYRKIAWQMAELMKKEEPYLGKLIEATSPEVEAPLCR